MKLTLFALSTLAFLFGNAGRVEAAFLNNATGLAGPHSTITFSEFGIGADTVITNQYSSLGATFSTNLYQNPQNFPAPNIDPTPDSLSNFQFSSGSIVNPFSIHFNTVQTAAAFAMITNFNNTLFEALLNGVVVDSAMAVTDTSNPNNFYGFTGLAFDEIRVTVGTDGNMILDNLQLSNATVVPAPSALVLLATAAPIGGYLGLRRRKRALAA